MLQGKSRLESDESRRAAIGWTNHESRKTVDPVASRTAVISGL
jgi:hypothetical protein